MWDFSWFIRTDYSVGLRSVAGSYAKGTSTRRRFSRSGVITGWHTRRRISRCLPASLAQPVGYKQNEELCIIIICTWYIGTFSTTPYSSNIVRMSLELMKRGARLHLRVGWPHDRHTTRRYGCLPENLYTSCFPFLPTFQRKWRHYYFLFCL